MSKQMINQRDFIEVIFRTSTHNFNTEDFFKHINYVFILDKKNKTEDKVITYYIFYYWIVFYSIKNNFPNLYQELLNTFIKDWWDRSQLEKKYKNLENFLLIINSDFINYNKAIDDETNPILNLSKYFLNHFFNREVTDIKTVFYVSVFVNETLKTYNKVFSELNITAN